MNQSWPARELDLFDLSAGHEERRLLALEIGDSIESELDQIFQVSQRIKWEGYEFNPVGFWKLYCGIINQAPGPREEWHDKGRQLLETSIPNRTEDADSLPIDIFLKKESQFTQYRGMLADCFECVYTDNASLRNHLMENISTIREIDDRNLRSLVAELWAYGYAEVSALITLAAMPRKFGSRSAWPFIDLNCRTIADWFLIDKAITGRVNGEVWFSWSIWTENWLALKRCAAIAPRYISSHFSYLAQASIADQSSFEDAEINFDYSQMITPWNHFNLMWLAIRLNDNDAALQHAIKLCDTTSVGETRAGRFINRLTHWSQFKSIREEIEPKLLNARNNLHLSSVHRSRVIASEFHTLWEECRDR